MYTSLTTSVNVKILCHKHKFNNISKKENVEWDLGEKEEREEGRDRRLKQRIKLCYVHASIPRDDCKLPNCIHCKLVLKFVRR